jgi:Domain of unknown function (DUF4266)
MKRILWLMGMAVLVLVAGCGRIDVKPYEREQLASPLLSFSRDPISDQYLDHVYEVREGARGASITTGGGCGCN